MKPKPTAHKATNTYKFESFHERLEKINISTINHLKRRFDADEQDENIPFFAIALEKWSDLNCTQDYKDIQQSIGSSLNFQTLRQILHRKKHLTEILINGLKVKESKALNAILELIVALARDILEEFYELEKGAYFATLLELLVDLTCQASEVDEIEALFVCLTFLFKYLRKWILRDIEQHFDTIKKALKSKKEHVSHFSSEVFSFLVKNASKQQATLIQLLFDRLEADSDIDRAVGRIFFESVKGVNQQFHSKAKQVFDIIFSKYVHSPKSCFDEMMHHFVAFLLDYSSVDSFKLVWNYLLLDASKFSSATLSKVVPLIDQAIRYKRCKLLHDSSQTLISLIEYLSKDDDNLDPLTTSTVLKSIENIFNYKNELPLEKVNYFCGYFYGSAFSSSRLSLDQILSFSKNVINCSVFDIVFNKFCCKLCLGVLESDNLSCNVSCLQFLAHLVISKRPRPVYGEENALISKYSLQFEPTEHGRTVEDIILEHLQTTTDVNTLLFCVTVIPHLPSFSSANTQATIEAIKSAVLKQLQPLLTSHTTTPKSSQIERATMGQLLLEMIVALVLFKEHKCAIDELDPALLIQLVNDNPDTIEFLQSLDIYLSYNKTVCPQFLPLSSPLLPQVYPLLQSHFFSSPRRLNRILSLHIAALFDLTLPSASTTQLGEPSRKSVFEICLDAELTSPDLASYRERLRHVRQLDGNLVSPHIPQCQSNIEFDSAPLYYLLGSLYENLNLLWKPTIEVLSTYSQLSKDKKQQLMTVLLEHFKQTNALILSGDKHTDCSTVYEQLFGIKSGSPLCNGASPPDHYNHRVLLLNAFECLSTIVEPRNREFVELFFEFVEGEMKSRFVYLSSCKDNLKNRDEEDEDAVDGVDLDAVKSSELKFQWRTFFAFLSVFNKFKNPKALFREGELTQMYMNLLISPNPALQRHAMKCLFTYNYQYITPYKDQFLRLLEAKTFSTEIHTFVQHDSEQDNVVSNEDRPQLMPIFLRILYGKLLSSSGTKVHGKSKIDFLRSLILKAISGFTEADQLVFMELIFASLQPLIDCDYDALPNQVAAFVSVDSFFVPFKQFNSLVTTLECLMKHFGSQSLPVMRRMLKVLLVCSSVCNQLLAPPNRVQLKEYIASLLKTFRTNCFKAAQYFFINFDRYPFTKEEIDALFAVLVQPLLANLQSESLDSPTPLLRLLRTWSENARYYVLLAKPVEPHLELTPLLAIIQLYSHPKVSSTTVTFITGIIENLLTFDGDKSLGEEDTIGAPINLGETAAQFPSHAVAPASGTTISFGSHLLIPHLKTILDRIYANYSTKIANHSKFEFTLQEVNILARLSFFVKDAEHSAAFSTLLLYSISQTRRPEEDKEVFTLKTLNHLARNILQKDFRKLLHLAFPLFQLVNKPLSRRELCTFVCTLCEKNDQLFQLMRLIGDINSFNVRLPEEPDFDCRITGFKQIIKLLDSFDESNDNQLDFIHLLLENCAFMINTYDDFSLKDLSSTVIIKICNLLRDCSQAIFDRYVMNIIFYKVISTGIRQPKESTRHEYIGVLVEATKIFSHRHEIVQQLRALAMEEEKNEEVDFWMNIKHIQLHRRARALNRLSQDDKLLSKMSPRVFTSFLIPIANSFINDPVHYSKNVSLFSAAVDSLAAFLQHCSWSKYDSTLSSYIHRLLNNKLDPKIAIRVISAMLGKFSFLKPDEVAQIEKELKADDLKNMSLEYSVARRTKSKQGKGGKFGKKNFGKNKKGTLKTDVVQSSDEKGEHTTVQEPINEDHVEEIEDNLEEAMDEEELENQEDVVDEDNSKAAADRLNQARKIYHSLCRKLLPLLHRCLHQRSQIEYMNDARDYKDHEFAEDDEIQRIPIALAIVKLLAHVKLNQQLFQANVTSIFLRLCQFLQSRADSIREASRGTLVQVMKTLGPQYFNDVFYEMRALLTRGYQRHIFIYTVYILMHNLTSQLNCGDLDHCMKDIIEICHQEMFGNLAEEKEVSHIVTKTKEAKKLKSYDIYEMLAQFVSQSALSGLLNPLRDVLCESGSHKAVKKAESAFHKICRGLVTNRFLTVMSLLPVLLEILASTEPEVVDATEGKQSCKIQRLADKLPSKLDSFLIPAKSLRRVHQVSKINRSSNLHVMSDFALTCILCLLKHNRLVADDASHKEMLEPTVEHMYAFLHSKDTKVITTSMQCLHSLLVKFPALDSFKQMTPKIISQIFVLLRKYSGLASDNTQLVTLCFKTIAHFINTRSDFKLNNEEIAVLLSYAENDIESNSQNTTIYLILKSIIKRKFVSKELHELMEKLLVLAITTEVDHVRNHAIELSIKYLTEYPIGADRFKGKMVKLTRQLEFKTVSGRIAAATILKSVVGILNNETLAPLKVTLFVPIASRIVNEESVECKKLISATVLIILSKLDVADRNNLFETFIQPWLACDDILVRTLASHLCSQLVKHEKHNFESRLATCLPLVRQQLDPSRYKSLNQPPDAVSEDGDPKHRNEDNLIFHHLTFVLHLLQLKPFNGADHFSVRELLTKSKYYEDFNAIFEYIAGSYLLHPHSWIRCLATQIFGQLFSLWNDPQSFVHDVDLYKNTYLFTQIEEVFFNLCKKFCLIFRDIYNCSTVSEQLMKNLVYLARVMIELDGEDENAHSPERKISLRWMINKLLFEVKFEIKSNPENFQKRILLAKWIAAVVYALYGEEEKRKDRVVKYLPNLLPPLCREDLSTSVEEVVDAAVKKAKEELAFLHRQVHDMLKSRLGAELYHDYYNQVRNDITHKKLERKKNRAIQMITQTDVGVKRKQRKHKRDRVSQLSKKRRIN